MARTTASRQVSEVTLPKGARWDAVLLDANLELLEASLPGYLQTCRWFGGKAREVSGATVVDTIPVPFAGETTYLTIVRVSYAEGEPDLYALPLALAIGEAAEQEDDLQPSTAVLRLRLGDATGIVYDATRGHSFPAALLDAVVRRLRIQGGSSGIVAESGEALQGLRTAGTAQLDPVVSRAEQSNTSIVYGGRLILKLVRRLRDGVNPDLEISRFLTERAHFANVPPLAGSLEYRNERGALFTLGVLQEFVGNQGDAWTYTLAALRDYWSRVSGMDPSTLDRSLLRRSPIELSQVASPGTAEEIVGSYLESARLLGRRTGELHLALASDSVDQAFRPESFTLPHQRFLYESGWAQTSSALLLLQSHLAELPNPVQKLAVALLDRREGALAKIRPVLDHRLGGRRVRTHGDFHLGQVLYTGDDFVFIDFEGEPARSMEERRAKRSPLRDVAGMLRSFDYAIDSALAQWAVESGEKASGTDPLAPWAAFWRAWVSDAYLQSYLGAVSRSGLLPEHPEDVALLLDVFLWEKAAYELAYELNNRPSWAGIPIRGLLRLLEP